MSLAYQIIMNYPIPNTPDEINALRYRPVNGDDILAAIAGTIKIARSQGQSLDDLTAEVLAEDTILDQMQRRWLSQIITQAWAILPEIS
ncbi:hypothetical protein CFPU101_07900 [Chroococcus sp. FPU101]|nr:hypothetical protein CFPU101_07900 [Chroococcus sp. FPU101]